MVNGPDVHFRVEDLNGDGQIEIVATNSFTKNYGSLLRLTEWGKHL